MKVLITSGGCKVPIDEVRHIGNFSSGRYGSEIASAFMRQSPDNHVYFIMEKGSKYPVTYDPATNERLENLNDYQYADYFEYVEKTKALIKSVQPDIIISAAAISDYVCDKFDGKFSSGSETFTLQLRKAEKVISSFRELAPNALIVGFKCLVNPKDGGVIAAALDKTFSQGCDLVVYNDLARLREGNANRTIFKLIGDKVLDQCSMFMCADAEALVEKIVWLNENR